MQTATFTNRLVLLRCQPVTTTPSSIKVRPICGLRPAQSTLSLHQSMSIARAAVRGAAWTMALNMLARGIGLVGTLVITRYLSPHAVGEVTVAMVLVMTAHQFSLLGLGHYVASKPDGGREAAFHSTVITLATGLVAIGGAVLLRGWLSKHFSAPSAVDYLPGLAVAIALDRITFVPSRVLIRDMRFRTNGIVRTAGEFVFPFVAVGLAMHGYGGWSLVFANIARAGVRALGVVVAVHPREWLWPCRLTMAKMREVLGFGLPNGVSTMAGYSARYWDGLIMARLFGPGELGFYQLAYNLSELPSNQVGDHVGDVLLPAFARLPPERRGPALARALRLLALVMFPLSIGMGVLGPTIVAVFLAPDWQPVGSRVMILSAVSAVYPLGFAIHSYLNASNHPRWVMVLGVMRTVVLLGSLALLGWLGGPLWACGGVGLGFGMYALVGILVACRLETMSPVALLRGLRGPLLACVPMVGAVLGVRALLGLSGIDVPLVHLVVELLVGAAIYVGSAFLLAPAVARELLMVLRTTLIDRTPRAPRGSATVEPRVAS
jgi:PST family polysaccharide transporter